MLGGCELAGRQDLHLPGADLSSGAVGSGTLACNSKRLEASAWTLKYYIHTNFPTSGEIRSFSRMPLPPELGLSATECVAAMADSLRILCLRVRIRRLLG